MSAPTVLEKVDPRVLARVFLDHEPIPVALVDELGTWLAVSHGLETVNVRTVDGWLELVRPT